MSDDLSRLIAAKQDEAIEAMYAANEEMARRVLEAGINPENIELVGAWSSPQVTPGAGDVPERITMTYTVKAQMRRRTPERVGPRDEGEGR